MTAASSPNATLLSDIHADIWTHCCSFLDYSNVERLIMVGSPRLTRAVSHSRRHLHAEWSSPEFIKPSALWRKWPHLTSISVRALRPLQLVSLPEALDVLPRTLKTLRFEFSDCLSLFFRLEDLKGIFPVLDTLELVETASTLAVRDVISLERLPVNLRRISLQTRGNTFYSRLDLAKLPHTLEYLDLDLLPLKEDPPTSKKEKLALEVLLPCRSLTYLNIHSQYLHLRNLPSSLTHLSLPSGQILELLKATYETVSPPISLKSLFPRLQTLILTSNQQKPHSLFENVPSSLTSIELVKWGSLTPGMLEHGLLTKLLARMPQVKRFKSILGAHAITCIPWFPNLEELDIGTTTWGMRDLSSHQHLKTVRTEHIIPDLPPHLTRLVCSEIPPREPGESFLSFPAALSTFVLSQDNFSRPSLEVVLALPTSLTHLDMAIGHTEIEAWKALKERLPNLVVLDCLERFMSVIGCPPSATFLPRGLRQLGINVLECKASEGSEDENLQFCQSWFREGFQTLNLLESLCIVGPSVPADFFEFLPNGIKDLAGPFMALEKSSAPLPPKLEELTIHAQNGSYVTLSEFYLDDELAKRLPRTLTHLEATEEISTGFSEDSTKLLPPNISVLKWHPLLIERYYQDKNVSISGITAEDLP